MASSMGENEEGHLVVRHRAVSRVREFETLGLFRMEGPSNAGGSRQSSRPPIERPTSYAALIWSPGLQYCSAEASHIL